MSRLGHYLAVRNQMPSWFLSHDFFHQGSNTDHVPPHWTVLLASSSWKPPLLLQLQQSWRITFRNRVKYFLTVSQMKEKHLYTDANCSCSLSSPTLCFPQLSRVVTALQAPQLIRTLPGVSALPVCGSPPRPQNEQSPTFVEISSLQNC